jgi:sarcosine oxidase
MRLYSWEGRINLILMITRDIVVAGAGAFGSWTARHLRTSGASVLLLDPWGPGHSRSSSGGESRIIRMGYGGNEIYTRMAMRSLAQWRQLLENSGEPLFHPTGVLWIGRAGHCHSHATYDTLEKVGVLIEKLTATDLARQYPQMRFDEPDTFGILEVNSGALMARRAIAALGRELNRLGVECMRAAVQAPSGKGWLSSVQTTDGQRISAGNFVFACGPWLPKIFREVLGNRIHVTRQEVFFFAPPAGDSRFCPSQLPVWIDFTDPRGPYGFPDLEGRGFKLAFDRHGPPFDPDSGDRGIIPANVAEAQAFLAERFPGLRDAPLVEFRVCQYENTCNGDFLVDRHPDLENVWLVGGGSGHGFKHGPAVGEHASARILAGAAAEPRFLLANKTETQSRTVY